MHVRSFSHTGITVSNFNRAVRFYWEIFGCPLVGVADTPPGRVRTFFGVDAADCRCRIGWIRAPGGAVIEIFEFQPQLPPATVRWHRVGLTHVAFNVRNLQRWYDYLVSQGVECVSRPERSPRGHSFFFARDFDGNLIELMDLGYMYHVLGWLGPLGGWLFRRGRYKRYYEASGDDDHGRREPATRPLVLDREEIAAAAAARERQRRQIAAARASAPPGKAPFDAERITALYERAYTPTGSVPRDREQYLMELEYAYYVSYPEVRTMDELAEALRRSEAYH